MPFMGTEIYQTISRVAGIVGAALLERERKDPQHFVVKLCIVAI